MIVKKILLAATAGALMAGPAWALPGLAPAAEGKGHGPSTMPNNTDSHKCTPHNVGYVASGTLVMQTLTLNTDGTYSGTTVEVEVKHTNHHAKKDNNTTKNYEVVKVHVTFGLADTDSDGVVGLDELMKGDRVKLIGSITVLAKKCSTTGFKATTTIRHLVFHAPVAP
jgi:hypothetical protein